MLDCVKNPVLALELSRQYKNRAYVIGIAAVYVVMFHPNPLGVVNPGHPLRLLLSTSPMAGMSAWLHDFLSDIYHPPAFALSPLKRQDDFWEAYPYMLGPVLGVIFLVVPVLAATSIVGERRRGTLMLVQLSLLRRFDIVWGAVVASIVPVLFPAWVCVISVVLSSWNVRQLIIGVVGVLVCTLGVAFIVAAVSVLISTFTKSDAVAIVMSYIMAFAVCYLAFYASYRTVNRHQQYTPRGGYILNQLLESLAALSWLLVICMVCCPILLILLSKFKRVLLKYVL